MAWAPDYITTAELKAFLRISDTVDDVQLAVAITAASRAIDDHCGRQFGKVASAEARTYTARYDYHRGVWVVDIDDLDDTTSFALTVAGTTETAYTLEPRNAVLKGMAYTRLVVDSDATTQPAGDYDEIVPTGKWGWTTVPTGVKQAAYVQASRFFSRRDSPYGIAGSPDQGSEMRLLSRVDPDVGVSLRKYRRQRRFG